MKHLIVCLFVSTILFACNDCPGEERPEACNDKESDVPVGNCEPLWNAWFYNADTKSCTQKAYSGCEYKGFETKEECEACKCSD